MKDNSRRNFLKLGALFVPAAIVVPRVAYSFLWPRESVYEFVDGLLVGKRLILFVNQADTARNGIWVLEDGKLRRRPDPLAELPFIPIDAVYE